MKKELKPGTKFQIAKTNHEAVKAVQEAHRDAQIAHQEAGRTIAFTHTRLFAFVSGLIPAAVGYEYTLHMKPAPHIEILRKEPEPKTPMTPAEVAKLKKKLASYGIHPKAD